MLIRNFEKIFNLKTRRSYIETTHRFGNDTVRISCDFIRKNPSQSRKMVVSTKNNPTPIHVILNNPDLKNDDTDSLNIILESLIEKYSYEEVARKSISIISRYNHDILRVKDSKCIKIIHSQDGEYIKWSSSSRPDEVLTIEYCTMHKSKGVTRDIVIILNMNSSQTGMPARRETDPFVDALLARSEKYPYAEERRLFYVAITRARDSTYLISDAKNPSPFILEICEAFRYDA